MLQQKNLKIKAFVVCVFIILIGFTFMQCYEIKMRVGDLELIYTTELSGKTANGEIAIDVCEVQDGRLICQGWAYQDINNVGNSEMEVILLNLEQDSVYVLPTINLERKDVINALKDLHFSSPFVGYATNISLEKIPAGSYKIGIKFEKAFSQEHQWSAMEINL